jgi:hypothetical protein
MILHTLFKRLRRPNSFESASSGHGDAMAPRLEPTPPPLPLLDPREVHEAIAQHHAWCGLFVEHLGADHDDSARLNALPSADSSALGQWMARLNQADGPSHPLLIELERTHRRVHRVALQALDFARHQRMDLASLLLNREFERSRSRLLEILHRLAQG